MQSTSIHAETLTAPSAVAEERFVTYSGAVAGNGANTLGVSQYKAAQSEDYAATVIGTATVVSGGAFALGAALQSDANGKAIVKSSGATVARALKAATGADERVEVLLIQN